MKRSEIFFTVLLVPLDLLALFAAFSLSYYLRNTYTLIAPDDFSSLATRLSYTGSTLVLPFEHYARYLSVIIPVMIAIFAATGLYAIRSAANWATRLVRITIGVSVGEFFILLLFLLKKDFFIPRATVLYSWILCILFVFAVHVVIKGIQKLLYRQGIGVVRLGIIGKNKVAEQLIERLTAKKYAAYRLAAHLDTVNVEEIAELIKSDAIDELIIMSSRYQNDDLITLRNYCLDYRISFSIVPPLLTELQSVFDVRSVGNLPMIEVRPTPLEGWGRVLKRLFDVISSLILIILFSPIYLIISLAMLVTDPGPLIFKHRRIGKDGSPISVYKFRTMRWEYCDGPYGHPDGDKNKARLFAELFKDPAIAKEWADYQKLKNDPRISGIGNIVRKTSLDELPQFFNVLFGSLSLVGPRPIIQEEVKKYGERARILFTVRPGVTGLWQVSGRNDVSYEERVALDAYYIEHWNLLSDIVIALKTGLLLVESVLNPNKKGAY